MPRAPLVWALLLCSLVGCDCASAVVPSALECSPRNPPKDEGDCPQGFYCSAAELCTRRCQLDSDCVTTCGGYGCNCRTASLVDGMCVLSCVGGFGQLPCAMALSDGGCDYDIYGPSRYSY